MADPKRPTSDDSKAPRSDRPPARTDTLDGREWDEYVAGLYSRPPQPKSADDANRP